MLRRFAPLAVGVAFLLVFGAGSASAATASPGWTLESFASPTNFSEAGNATCEGGSVQETCQSYEVTAANAGSEPTSGPVTIEDTLPEGLSVIRIMLYWSGSGINGQSLEQKYAEDYCVEPSAHVVKCVLPEEVFTNENSVITPVKLLVQPDQRIRLDAYVSVGKAAANPLVNKAAVSGGGAPTVSTEATNQVSSNPPPFGVSRLGFFKDALNGTEETQAGGHPYELVTTIDFNNEFREGDFTVPEFTAPEDVRDIIVNLPLGFAGSTLSAPECTLAQLSSEQRCPPDTIIGHLHTEPENSVTNIEGPIWNIVPEHGFPAEFGYVDNLKGAHTFYTHVVPTSVGYVLQTSAIEIPQINLTRIVATFYGDPAERDNTGETEVPFFTNPTACSNGPQVADIWVDSWQHPAKFEADGIPTNLSEAAWAKNESVTPPVTGCNALQFTPELGAQPTTHQADSPTGLEFETKLAQSETFGVDATPALKNLTVDFPAGMTVDPSSADGLETCSEAQIGYEGPTLFDFNQAKPACPEASKIGSLELETPLIPGKLDGEVYLASQDANPFGSTFAIYVVVNDPTTGVVLKIAGELKANPSTGQLTSVFEENPQLPFSVLQVHFFGGPRAELATPPNCGIYTTNSEMEPWSAPDSGPIGTPFDNYEIDENCAIGFNPSFTGGSTNLQGGAFTTFQASFERQDSDQELQGAKFELPPGMLANLASVSECGAAEIQAEVNDAPTGGCPASSKVGTVQAGAGPGPNPLFVPGNVFFTGPYKGAPFGLAVVVSANPGPFHFGNVVVRQQIQVNPQTAAVTDVSDTFPTYLDPRARNSRTGVEETTGIPIKLRRVDVQINRPGFTFNPANCDKETFEVGGQISSVGGLAKTLATPFQVTNCGVLKYEPKLTVTTSAKTSKADGASLHFLIAYPKTAGIGNEAWFKTMKFTIPKQLPARLTTIQKACLAKVFEANPAACPKESLIGSAVVHTPILPTTLAGPLYFVSYGNTKFPEAVLDLQGDGVQLIVHGETFISRSGVTSATFKTVPEAPFESAEVSVPTGPYSEFAANGNLCKQAAKLAMPIEFTASDGALIKQNTKIGVSGCPKGKPAKKAKHKAKSPRKGK